LRRILGSLGTQEPYAGFALLAAMWNLICNEGIWYPEEGLKSFCNRLVQSVTGGTNYGTGSETQNEGKGIIMLKAEVKRIRIENGRICGIVLADETAIDAPFVISNADYKTTFIKLLELDTSGELYKAVSEARQSGSILQVAIGVTKDKVDLSAFSGASRLIYRNYQSDSPPEEDNIWDEECLHAELLADQELEISLWSNEDASLSPDWGAVVVIRTEAPYRHFRRFHLGSGSRSSGYREYKNQLGKALIDEVELILPGLQSAITVMDIATPLTFEDQGGRTEGAVAGWSWNYEDFHDYRSRELVSTPIRGLYMAGYQAYSALFMGGVPTAMVSGYRAAEAVLDNAGPIAKLCL
jgi:phytoene dehydrogenase-like protein